jgi:hypothetical protein
MSGPFGIPSSCGGGPFGSHPHGPSNSPFGLPDPRIVGHGPGGPIYRSVPTPGGPRYLTPCEAYLQQQRERAAAAWTTQQARKRETVLESTQPFRPSKPTYPARTSSVTVSGSRESTSEAELDAGLRDCLACNNLRIDEEKAKVVLVSYFLRDHIEML